MQVLQFALRTGPNPLCVERCEGLNPGGYLRSSNSAYSRSLTPEEADLLVLFLKRLAGLDINSRQRGQSGKFVMEGRSYKLNYCPQMDGEILVIHCTDDALDMIKKRHLKFLQHDVRYVSRTPADSGDINKH